MSGQPRNRELFVRELTRHRTRLCEFVRCLLFDPKQAEDVLQDTNVVLLRKAAEYQHGSDFWAWASQAARFQVLTHAKRLGRERLVFDEELMESLAVESQRRAASLDERRFCGSTSAACRAARSAGARSVGGSCIRSAAGPFRAARRGGRQAGYRRPAHPVLAACCPRRTAADAASRQ